MTDLAVTDRVNEVVPGASTRGGCTINTVIHSGLLIA